MYAATISPRRQWQDRDHNGAPVAGVGGSHATADPGPATRTAADHWRSRVTIPHLADRRNATPHRALGRWAYRKSEAWARATLLPQCDDVATDLSTLVRSAGGGLGIRNP